MKIGSYSETLLRLEVTNRNLINQGSQMEYSFVGTGINFLTVQSYVGNQTYLISVLPDNQLGDGAMEATQKRQINSKFIFQKGNDMTSYVLESGYHSRPSQVLYQNRKNSCHNNYLFSVEQVDDITTELDALHVCGIGLAFNQTTRTNVLNLSKAMNDKGKQVLFDCNYRSALWDEENYEKSRPIYKQILMYCDIVSMSTKDAINILEVNKHGEESIFQTVLDEYGIKCIIGTKRIIKNNNQNQIAAFIKQDKFYYETEYIDYHILDRIGAGDAFFSYIISFITNCIDTPQLINEALNYSIQSQSINGDIMPMSIKRFKQIFGRKGLIR